MVNRNSADQFEKAGAQAAEVLGRFVNIAAGLSRELDGVTKGRRDDAEDAANSSAGTTYDSENKAPEKDELLREVGEQLRELRRAAGYTLDGFASALDNILKTDAHGKPVARTIDAVESGNEAPPLEWVQALSQLLGGNDVRNLFDQVSGKRGTASSANDSVHTDRMNQLSDIFAADPEIESLSDEEFQKLTAFISASYQQAKLMIKK